MMHCCGKCYQPISDDDMTKFEETFDEMGDLKIGSWKCCICCANTIKTVGQDKYYICICTKCTGKPVSVPQILSKRYEHLLRYSAGEDRTDQTTLGQLEGVLEHMNASFERKEREYSEKNDENWAELIQKHCSGLNKFLDTPAWKRIDRRNLKNENLLRTIREKWQRYLPRLKGQKFNGRAWLPQKMEDNIKKISDFLEVLHP